MFRTIILLGIWAAMISEISNAMLVIAADNIWLLAGVSYAVLLITYLTIVKLGIGPVAGMLVVLIFSCLFAWEQGYLRNTSLLILVDLIALFGVTYLFVILWLEMERTHQESEFT